MAGMGSAIRAGLARGTLKMDWSSLNAWIAPYALPPGLVAGELPAGLRLSDRAGPR
jgi:hypothetical protein